MLPWSAFPGACFSGMFDVLECLDGLQMVVVWLDKHPPSWKSPYDWPESFAIKLASIWVQMGLRWDHQAVFNFYTWKNPTTPDLHPYVIICDTGVKTI